MWSHFLSDQNWKFICNTIFFSCHIRSCIGPDCKLTHWDLRMMVQNIILNICTILLFSLKVCTRIINHLSAVKYQLQILKLQSVQINLLYMKNPTGSGQHRRSKHFSHWNIYICHTIFKICLFSDIFQFMQMNDQICLVVIFSFYFYPLTGIQRLNDRLLYPFILFIIQCIDLHNLCKNL